MAQLALALLLVPLIALWPHAGTAVLILPLPGQASSAGLWARQQGLPMLGIGIARGSLILNAQRQYTPFSALGAGALMIAVPASLCRSTTSSSAEAPPRLPLHLRKDTP